MNISNLQNNADKNIVYRSAQGGDVEIVRQAQKAGMCVQEVFSNKDTLLHVACRTGNAAQLDILVEYEVDFTAKNDLREDAFIVVCRNGDVSLQRQQLQYTKLPSGLNYLRVALEHRHIEIARQQIKQAAPVAYELIDIDVLNTIVKNNDIEAIEWLQETDFQRERVLFRFQAKYAYNSIQCMQPELATQFQHAHERYQQSSPYNRDVRPISTQFVACVEGDLDTVKHCVHHGVSPSDLKHDLYAVNCVYAACLLDRSEVLQYLQEQDGRLALRRSQNQPSLQYTALKYQRSNSACALQSWKDEKNKQILIMSALQDAARANDLAATTLLFSKGKALLSALEPSQHPLYIAISCGSHDLVKYYIDQKVDREDAEPSQSQSLQQLAAIKGHTNLFVQLAGTW